MNANTIISNALRDLQVIPSGGTPTAAQYADGLALLNDMLNEWSVNGSLVYEDTLEELTITTGTQSFSIGASGDQTSARPVSIISANLKDSDDNQYHLKEIDDKQYARLGDKTSTGLPCYIYLRKTVPNSNIYFDCTTDKAYTLVLTSMKHLSTFPDGTTDVALPEQYSMALRKNLAVEGAGMFGASKRVTPMMLNSAERSKATIVGDALQLNASRTDIGGGSRYNINSDGY